jgi:hypothetical protein
MRRNGMRTNDGITLRATSAAEIVTELHQKSHTPAASDEDFMAETAKRCFEQSGVWIDTASAQGFVDGLVKLGFLKAGDDEQFD